MFDILVAFVLFELGKEAVKALHKDNIRCGAFALSIVALLGFYFCPTGYNKVYKVNKYSDIPSNCIIVTRDSVASNPTQWESYGITTVYANVRESLSYEMVDHNIIYDPSEMDYKEARKIFKRTF